MRRFDPKHRRPQKTCQFHRLSAANAFDQMLDMRDRRVGHDAMAEVEDMGTIGEGRQDAVDRRIERAAPRDERERVELRSEERRAGKECVRTDSSRWGPCDKKKKNT